MSPVTSTEQTFTPDRVQQIRELSIAYVMRNSGVLNNTTGENWDYTAIK